MSLSSIIKNYRILEGNVITIGEKQVEEPSLTHHENQYEENQYEAMTQVVQEVDFSYLEEEAKQKAEKEALRIVEQAKQQANALLEEAEAQKETDMSQFYMEKANLEAKAKVEYENILEMANSEKTTILQQAYEEKESIIRQAEAEVVEVMTHLLQRIIDAKIISGKEWLTLFVQQAIEKEQLKEDIKVFLSKYSFDMHADTLAKSFAIFPIQIHLEINGQLSDSECVIETSTGTIAYNIAKGLEQVVDEIGLLCGAK